MSKKNSSTSSSKRYSASPAAATPVTKAQAPVAPATVAKDSKVTLPAVTAVPETAAPKTAKPAVESKTAAAPVASADHSKSADAAAVSALIADLRGSDADLARDAAISLGAQGGAAAVEPLIEVLNNVDGYFHSVVRAAAASSLAQIGDARAVEALLGAVRDPQGEPSAEAIRALATLGDKRAVNVLIEVVRNSTGYFSSIARRAAILALSSFKDEQAVAELRAVSDDTWEDSVIRQAAIDALQEAATKHHGK